MSFANIGRIFKLIQKHRNELVARSKVKQLCVGYKVIGGRITDTVGIVIFVTKKWTESELQAMQVEPVADRKSVV